MKLLGEISVAMVGYAVFLAFLLQGGALWICSGILVFAGCFILAMDMTERRYMYESLLLHNLQLVEVIDEMMELHIGFLAQETEKQLEGQTIQ